MSEFEALANEVADGTMQAIEMLRVAFDEMANGLRGAAARGADIVVEPDQEHGKRENIALWRSEAERLSNLAVALDRVPVSASTLQAEIKESLMRGFHQWLASQEELPGDTRDSLAQLMHERAANIAMAYADRVLPEPK